MCWIPKIDSKLFEIIEMIIAGIIPIILILIGTIGNFLCINYFLRYRHRQRRSIYIYFIFLCLIDTFSLYQLNLNSIVMIFNNGKQLSQRSLGFCRSITFFSFYTLHLSAIFLTLMIIDRTFTFWLNFYRNHMTKCLQTLIISLIIFIFLFILDGFHLSSGIINQNTTQIICYYFENINLIYFYTEIYSWIHFIIIYIIPYPLMIICIILILIKLRIHRTNTGHFNSNQRLSIMLVKMCILYVLLTLLNLLCFSVFFSVIVDHVYTDMILLTSNTLLYTRNAINILFLYMNNIKFRKQLNTFCSFYCRQQNLTRVRPIERMDLVIRTEQIQSVI